MTLWEPKIRKTKWTVRGRYAEITEEFETTKEDLYGTILPSLGIMRHQRCIDPYKSLPNILEQIALDHHMGPETDCDFDEEVQKLHDNYKEANSNRTIHGSHWKDCHKHTHHFILPKGVYVTLDPYINEAQVYAELLILTEGRVPGYLKRIVSCIGNIEKSDSSIIRPGDIRGLPEKLKPTDPYYIIGQPFK